MEVFIVCRRGVSVYTPASSFSARGLQSVIKSAPNVKKEDEFFERRDSILRALGETILSTFTFNLWHLLFFCIIVREWSVSFYVLASPFSRQLRPPSNAPQKTCDAPISS